MSSFNISTVEKGINIHETLHLLYCFQSYRKTLNRARKIIKWPEVEIFSVRQGFLKASIRWMMLSKVDEYRLFSSFLHDKNVNLKKVYN